MKKIILLITIIFTTTLSVGGQTVVELEGRWVPIPEKTSPWWNQIEEEPTCKEKIIDLWWEVADFFTPEEDLCGVTYNYSGVFPIGLTIDRSWDLFKLGLDLGFSLDNKKYYDKFNPFSYIGVSPGLYMRFISIDLGLGVLYSYAIEKKQWTDTTTDDFGFSSEDGSTSVSGSITTTIPRSETKLYSKYNFLLKPSVTVYIPLDSWEESFLTLNGGYNFFYNFERINGWFFGIGFHWAI